MTWSLGFHEKTGTRERESIENQKTKENYQLTVCVEDIFGFAEHQENATYGLGYKLTLKRNSKITVLSHEPGAGVDDTPRTAAYRALEGRIFISDLSWYIPY